MQIEGRFCRFAAGIVLIILAAAIAALRAQVPSGSLLRQGDVQYLGAFRLPAAGVSNPGTTGAFTDCGYVTNPPGQVAFDFGWSETGMAFNPGRRSLFINNHIYEQKTGEISIPLELTTSRNLNDLPRAQLLHKPVDLAQGNLWKFGVNGACHQDGLANMIGGLLVWKDTIVADVYGTYSPASTIERSHFTHSVNLDAQDFAGIFSLESKQPYPGTSVPIGSSFLAGPMALVPSEWQAALGGPALTGLCCVSMTGRTSYGPALFAFNPDDLGVKNPVPHTPLLFYPEDHQTLGRWDDTTSLNLTYNMMTRAKGGIVVPEGSGSVLVFGSQATNGVCYGGGTLDPALHKQPWTGGQIWCYDPYTTDVVGPHPFPLPDGSYAVKPWVWAYRAADLAQVKAGTLKPWDVKPYTVFELYAPPFNPSSSDVIGVGYDPATQRLYVGFHLEDGTQPLIGVYQLNLAGGSAPTSPTSSVTSTTSSETTTSSSSVTSTPPPDTNTPASSFTDSTSLPTFDSSSFVSSSSTPTTTPLTLSCPTIAPIRSPNGNPVTVTFDSPVAGGGTAPVTTSCIPASGSQFPVGSTPVTCGVSDALGQTASCTMTITVVQSSSTTKRVQRRLRRYRPD